MSSARPLRLLTVFSMVVALAATRATAQGGEPDATPKVAVVDIQRVFDEAPLTKELLAEVTATSKRLEAELEQLRKRRDDLELAASEYVEGSVDGERARQAFQSAAWDYEQRTKRYFNLLQRQKLEKMTQAFAAVADAVRELAEKRGIDLVLRINVPSTDEDVRDKLERIQRTVVVYHGTKLDLTGDVIRLMKARRPAADDGAAKDASGNTGDGR